MSSKKTDLVHFGQQDRGQAEPVQTRVEQQAMVEPPPLRRSKRVLHPLDRYIPSIDYIMLTDCGEPSCYKEAVQVADSKKWQLAMQSEMQVLHKNHTWDLVKLPQGKHALPCKWV